MPWLGFFDKVCQADVFVLLDNVQYRKNYYQNRNKIYSGNGVIWITVPVLTRGRFGQRIDQVVINNQGSPRWREKCWASVIQCYERTPFWSQYGEFFRQIYTRDWESLSELNIHLIDYLLKVLSIDVETIRASEMDVSGQGSELILDICKRSNADIYLAGVSGKDYLKQEDFCEAGIRIAHQEFHHPIYKQLHDPFQPFMSIIDLLFNYGQESINIIRGIGVETLDYILE